MIYLIGLAMMLATLVGGLLGHRIRDRKHLALGLAGGLMLGVIFFDIVPESLRISHTYQGVSLGMLALTLGFVLVHFFERLAHNKADHEELRHHVNPGVFALIGHSFLDGLGIGLAFQASHALGILFAVAVIAHDLGDGFNARMIGGSLKYVAADALAPLAGILIGSSFALNANALGLLLGLFGGSLLYLATSDILPEAHASHPTRLTFIATAVGIGIMYLLIGAIG